MLFAVWFGDITFIALYVVVMLGIIGACWIFSKMSKSMADTGEIDAIAWLLTTAPQHPATFFKKAGQMVGSDSIGCDYRPRLLESLLPLLTLLITSHHAPQDRTSETIPRRSFKIELKREQSDDVLDGRYGLPTSLSLVYDDTGPIDEHQQLENLEIYVACLARLSEFTDNEGNPECLWEDTMQHPKLERQLIDKLVEFANPRHDFRGNLRSAATKVLNNYGLDMEGNSVSPATVVPVRSVCAFLRSADLFGVRILLQERGHFELGRPVELATRVEPPQEGIEEV